MADIESQIPLSTSLTDFKKSAAGNGIDHGVFDLTVSNLTYKVSHKGKAKVAEEKVLLSSVNAKARHGQILAVVGPSGAGKSTFLDAVAGRIDPKSLEGSVLVNGKPIDATFNRQSGYVMQDDALFPMLTVRETLMFSARLRLPSSMSTAEKKERVELLINALGLQGCAETKIGNEEMRGVSGGERRRVSIGVDLIHDPPVLFLDEPTSGLDSTSALNVIQNLNALAEKRRRTIVLTIHQPSFRILDLMHSFLILAKGHAIFHGPYSGLVKHFTDFGRVVPEHVNTLEYALDLIEAEQATPNGLAPLIAFNSSGSFVQAEKDAGSIEMSVSSLNSSLGQLSAPEFASNFLAETAVLCDRNFKNIFRTKELFLSRVFLYVFSGLILGTLFLHSRHDSKGIANRASFFSFILAAIFFTSSEALPIFLAEREVFIRETSRGAYRTSSYVVANALVFLPFLLFLAIFLSAITYFTIGLVPDAGGFLLFVLTTFLALALGNSYVTFWEGIVPNYIIGNTIITATAAFFFLFGGFFIPRQSIPKYWIWLHYMSNFKYPLELYEHNEYSRLNDVCWDDNANDLVGCQTTSQDVLNSFSAGAVHVWLNILVLVVLFVGYRVLFYFALKVQTSKLRK